MAFASRLMLSLSLLLSSMVVQASYRCSRALESDHHRIQFLKEMQQIIGTAQAVAHIETYDSNTGHSVKWEGRITHFLLYGDPSQAHLYFRGTRKNATDLDANPNQMTSFSLAFGQNYPENLKDSAHSVNTSAISIELPCVFGSLEEALTTPSKTVSGVVEITHGDQNVSLFLPLIGPIEESSDPIARDITVSGWLACGGGRYVARNTPWWGPQFLRIIRRL